MTLKYGPPQVDSGDEETNSTGKASSGIVSDRPTPPTTKPPATTADMGSSLELLATKPAAPLFVTPSSRPLMAAPTLEVLASENERLEALLQQSQLLAERRRQAIVTLRAKLPDEDRAGDKPSERKGGRAVRPAAAPFPGSNSGQAFESLDDLRGELAQVRHWLLSTEEAQHGLVEAAKDKLSEIQQGQTEASARDARTRDALKALNDRIDQISSDLEETRGVAPDSAEATLAEARRGRSLAVALRRAAWDGWRNTAVAHGAKHRPIPGARRARRALRSLGRAGRGLVIAMSGLWSDSFMPAMAHGGVTFAADVFEYAHDRGRNSLQPRAFFDQKFYLEQNPDIAAAAWSPLMHYILYGEAEGRDPHPLFDVDFYRGAYASKLAESGLPPLLHFLNLGAKEGCNPHPLFDVIHYVSQCPDLARTGENPLLHYLREGWLQGRDPHALFDNDLYLSLYLGQDETPVPPLLHYVTRGAARGHSPHALFDGRWFAQRHMMGHGKKTNPLVEFLRHGALLGQSGCAEFDARFYLDRNPDVAAYGVNPLLHYVTMGAWEHREPSRAFFTPQYLAQHPDAVSASETPLAHWVKRTRIFGAGATEPPPRGKAARPGVEAPRGEAPQAEVAESFSAPSKAVAVSAPARTAIVEYALPTPRRARKPPTTNVRLIAFYLPQFHPIPENDAWWGKGFTEWTNVRKATPQFVGHYQPHSPGDLGYYDLLADESILTRQVELAKAYGLGGFCFYFYWFAGKRLLEDPIAKFASDPQLNFPFCLCWANENWSRRWDGLDAEILIAQDHSAKDDLAFIKHIAQYLKNPNYIRIDGKPLLMVYRPSLLPNAAETAERWRRWCRANGVGEIFLGYTQSFETVDPRTYGFDAAVEFPPNNTAPPVITDEIERLNPDFAGTVYDYRIYLERSEDYAKPDYPLFRGVFPSWDNEARRTGRGTVFHHATPGRYRAWLTNAARETANRLPAADSRLVFVNAWNEWAEGAHLEPDAAHGYAYLEATRDALEAAATMTFERRVVVVCHDAHPHGAQFLSLNIARVLSQDLGFIVDIVLLGDGPLKPEFEAYGRVHDLSGFSSDGSEARALAARFARDGVGGAICNTSVCGKFLGALADAGLRTLSLVHEMQGVIEQYGLQEHCGVIAAKADKIIFASEPVQKSFSQFATIDADKVRLRTQGLYKRNGAQTVDARLYARQRLRKHFGLDQDVKIVLGVAFGDRRKGVDIFVDVGRKVMQSRDDVVFLWVGAIDPTISVDLSASIAASGVAERFLFVGFQAQTEDYYAGADIYAMTSREDPFPTVLMEAFDAALPVVAFEGVGGFEALLRSGCGELAPSGDVTAFAAAIRGLLLMPDRRTQMGEVGRAKIASDYDFTDYVRELATFAVPPPPTVSVVVPNYNYERFIRERLGSIDAQTMPVHELVVLDDASTDGSVTAIEALLPKLRASARLILNKVNSKSVFRQWKKGVEACTGDLVWIAEADDLADPDFLRIVTKAFEDPKVVLSFCQSRMINDAGRVTAPDYLDYTRDVSADRWLQPYVVEGVEEIRAGLAIKNTIPNVSGVVFRRDALLEVLRDEIDEIADYRVAGDWVTYLKLALKGRIAFTPKTLNLHRRHDSSVTLGDLGARQLEEIVRVQKLASELGNTPKASRKAAGVYAQALYEQFGLVGEHQKIANDPQFSPFLRG